MTHVVENTVGVNAGLGVEDNEWISITNYVFVNLTERSDVALRLDWFDDDDGQRVKVNGAGEGNYFAATLGLNFMPSSFVRIRPEVRWDWFTGAGLPFDSRDGGLMGTATNQFTSGLDCVITF